MLAFRSAAAQAGPKIRRAPGSAAIQPVVGIHILWNISRIDPIEPRTDAQGSTLRVAFQCFPAEACAAISLAAPAITGAR